MTKRGERDIITVTTARFALSRKGRSAEVPDVWAIWGAKENPVQVNNMFPLSISETEVGQP